MKKQLRWVVLGVVAAIALTSLLAYYFAIVVILTAVAGVGGLAAGFLSRESEHGFLGAGDARRRNESGAIFGGASLLVVVAICLVIGSSGFRSLNDGLIVYGALAVFFGFVLKLLMPSSR
jgi:hypothetical protein